ncbi:thioredoxin-related transmembrane protein 4 isoform X2 [Ambystoma mexicanum]|uniref:thioredoxin-related transmembrane protein 4 isoform X2 n=1 Tax=Ambystoma mexicanum TaxID=8296 RepID=UPI0037E9935E
MAGCNGRDTGTGANSEPPMRRPNCPAGPCRARLAAPALLLAAALLLGSQAAVKADKSSLASSDLTASNWTLLLQGEWMVKFFAPWCSACQQIQAEWEKFAESSMALDVTVGKVDVTQEPGLSGRFFVTTLPTIFHAKDGIFRKYRGPRTSEELQSYVMLKKWEAVEPVSGWKSPSSITMYGMAGLFHLSGWIRQIHNYFTGPLGIPVWGSCIIFILAILLIGLVLGLMLVLIADCICPPKRRYRVERSEINEKENMEVSDEELEEQEEPLEEKKELSDIEDEENDASARASGEDSEAAEDGDSQAREQGEDNPDQHSADPNVDTESSVRQRKAVVKEDEQ